MLKNYSAGPATAWESLAKSALSIGRKGDTKSALAILNDALDAARRSNEPRGEALSLNCAAIVHVIRGDYWTSLATSIDAYSLAHQQNLPADQANAMVNLAAAFVLLAPDDALPFLREAHRIAQRVGDAGLLSRAHNMLGVALGDMGRFDEAELNFDMAQAMTDGVNGDDANNNADELNPLNHFNHFNPFNPLNPMRLQTNLANLMRKRAKAARRTGGADALASCVALCAHARTIINRIEGEAEASQKLPLLIDILMVAGLIDLADDRPGSGLRKLEQSWQLSIATKQRAALPTLGVHIGRVHIGRLEMAAGRAQAVEQTLTVAFNESLNYRPSPKAEALCLLLAEVRAVMGDATGESGWQREALKARVIFNGIKSDALRQLEKLAKISPSLFLDCQLAARPSTGR